MPDSSPGQSGGKGTAIPFEFRRDDSKVADRKSVAKFIHDHCYFSHVCILFWAG